MTSPTRTLSSAKLDVNVRIRPSKRSLHEAIFMLWEWGKADRCSASGRPIRAIHACGPSSDECRTAAMPKWVLLPLGAAAAEEAEKKIFSNAFYEKPEEATQFLDHPAIGHIFAYNSSASYYPLINALKPNLFSTEGKVLIILCV